MCREGADETANVVIRQFGEPRKLNFPAKQHFELGEALGMMDFEMAAKMAGSRFTILRGKLARLERALGQFMLDLHTQEHGYEETAVPLLVNDAAAYGTDKLPKFAEDLFQTTDGRWLIPTAEVPLTFSVAGEILPEARLPIRLTALSDCFRSEAGSAGRDTRGMLRQHQFRKVELVSITHPDQSDAEHERMTRCAETVLERLDLPYRRIVLCSGDTGFGAAKTFDLEVWLPGQGAWREISSCSNTRAFQARRMNARFRATDGKTVANVHTLNGSGVALGRALIAVMENYQQSDGSIADSRCLTPLPPRPGPNNPLTDKSFLVLFSKKEQSSLPHRQSRNPSRHIALIVPPPPMALRPLGLQPAGSLQFGDQPRRLRPVRHRQHRVPPQRLAEIIEALPPFHDRDAPRLQRLVNPRRIQRRGAGRAGRHHAIIQHGPIGPRRQRLLLRRQMPDRGR